MVLLPDQFPSSLHDRSRDPISLYPCLHEIEAWEPNDDPHEREVMEPNIGGWRIGQDFPVDMNCSTALICKQCIFL